VDELKARLSFERKLKTKKSAELFALRPLPFFYSGVRLPGRTLAQTRLSARIIIKIEAKKPAVAGEFLAFGAGCGVCHRSTIQLLLTERA
jgi:hypothetical protein